MLGHPPAQLIDADTDTDVIGNMGTGAEASLYVVDLTIDVAISRNRNVVLDRVEELSLFQECLLSRGFVGSVWAAAAACVC